MSISPPTPISMNRMFYEKNCFLKTFPHFDCLWFRKMLSHCFVCSEFLPLELAWRLIQRFDYSIISNLSLNILLDYIDFSSTIFPVVSIASCFIFLPIFSFCPIPESPEPLCPRNRTARTHSRFTADLSFKRWWSTAQGGERFTPNFKRKVSPQIPAYYWQSHIIVSSFPACSLSRDPSLKHNFIIIFIIILFYFIFVVILFLPLIPCPCPTPLGKDRFFVVSQVGVKQQEGKVFLKSCFPPQS